MTDEDKSYLGSGSGISVFEEVKHHIEDKAIKEIIDLREKADKKALGKYQRLTPSQWREIDMLWESGEVTLKDLCEKYGKQKDTFIAHFRKNGIKKGARAEELRKLAEKAAREKAAGDAAVLSDRIRRTKEEHYKMAEAIGKLTFGEVLKARQDGRQFRSIQQDLKALLLAAETLKKVREERWVTLGLDKDAVDEDSLPELVMSTMTEDQVQQMRNAQMQDEQDLGINDEDLMIEND